MRREDAISKAIKTSCDAFEGNWDCDAIHKELINKIYDDFESRTCENCKFVRNIIPMENEKLCPYIGDAICKLSNHYFGCNQFERKTNE